MIGEGSRNYTAPGASVNSLTSPIGGSVPEQMTLQQQGNHLAFLIERAHAILDDMTNVPTTPSQNQADATPLGTALQLAISRADDLIQRLTTLQAYVGHV